MGPNFNSLKNILVDFSVLMKTTNAYIHLFTISHGTDMKTDWSGNCVVAAAAVLTTGPGAPMGVSTAMAFSLAFCSLQPLYHWQGRGGEGGVGFVSSYQFDPY